VALKVQPGDAMPERPTEQPQPVRSLFIDDAARVLGVSRRTVYYRIREGRLQTIRTRCGSQRVLMSSVEALLDEQQAAAALRDGAGGARS
jgi:excisionase family DNA binding protein